MRCKNCGSQNDDKLYICQNCGSPLYDENEDANTYDEDLDKTIVAPAIKKNKQAPQKSRQEAEADKKKNQQITAVIIALAVVLLAIIIVTVSVVAASHKKEEETTTITTTTEQTTIDNNAYTKSTTTETTTETTTTAEKFIINATCGQGGEIEGDGEYTKGEKCVLVARADDSYDFAGWYENGKLISSKEIYRFTVDGDRTIKAVFEEVTTDGYTFVEEEVLEGNLE